MEMGSISLTDKEWNFKLINPQFEDLFRFDYLSLSTSINTYETVWESL